MKLNRVRHASGSSGVLARLHWILTVSGLVCFLYLASLGPLAYFTSRSRICSPALDKLYTPAGWVFQTSEVYSNYVIWFARQSRPQPK
jgi:hypothetical protein